MTWNFRVLKNCPYLDDWCSVLAHQSRFDKLSDRDGTFSDQARTVAELVEATKPPKKPTGTHSITLYVPTSFIMS